MILEFHEEKYNSLKEMYIALIKEFTLIGDKDGDLKPTIDEILKEMKKNKKL